jgi:hypothetical protein
MIPALLDRCRTAIIAAIYPSPPGTAPQRCRRDPVDALLDESSLLTLAEAIARKISKDRAAIVGQGRIPDAVLSQEVCRFLTLLKPLNPTTQSGDPFPFFTVNARTKSCWPPRRCSCPRFAHSRRSCRPCGL